MKKSTLWIIILAALAIVVLWAVRGQRKMVAEEENVKKAWAQVETVYQRRADLVPNLQNIVAGAANYEKGTLTEVIEARAKASSVIVDADNLNEEQVATYQKAQDALTSAMQRSIQLTVERYPELTATAAFRDFQTQYEGCENRIAVERKNYTEAVQRYNTLIRQFPNNLLAGLFGFDRMGQFTAAEGADVAPTVNFEF